MTAVDTEKLYATTDAQVWAQEFMKIIESGSVVDEGLMIGWFANAIQTARRIGAEEGKVAYARELLAFTNGLRDRRGSNERS